MKITLSKSQWEMIGSKAGWMKKAGSSTPIPTQDVKNIVENIRFTIGDITKPESVSGVTDFDPKAPRSVFMAFQVITRTIGPLAKKLYTYLQEIEKMQPNLSQEINALITNGPVGFLSAVSSDAMDLYNQGAIGNEGQSNGSTQKLIELIESVKSRLPLLEKSVTNFVDKVSPATAVKPQSNTQPQAPVPQAPATASIKNIKLRK